MRESGTKFDAHCTRCPRLAKFLAQVREEYPAYYARPVPAFGPSHPRLLIVGLAPGMHGANATGRPFTGDYAGILLYETLHKYGFSSQAESTKRDDGLTLFNCRITNAVRCLPPQNKPTTDEVKRCNTFLERDLSEVAAGGVVLALGAIAHAAVLRALGLRAKDFPFAHGACAPLPNGLTLVDSYHCSRYNTQTRRLTHEMFYQVFEVIRDLLDDKGTKRRGHG